MIDHQHNTAYGARSNKVCQCLYSTYTGRRSASQNCIISKESMKKCCYNALHEKHQLPAVRNLCISHFQAWLSPPLRATRGHSRVLTARRVGFSPDFLCPGCRVFNSINFPQFWKKNTGIARFLSKKLEAAWKAGVLVLFHTNFCKCSRCLLYR